MNEITNPNSNSNEFEQLLSESFSETNLKEGSIVKGLITQIEDDAVIVDVNGKTEGRINKREFAFLKDKQEIEVGMEISVYLDKIESYNGECVLSYSKAQNKVIWKEIEKKFESGELIDGEITGKTKGGLSCEIGLTAFLPGSQIDTRPVRDISHLIGIPQKFKILKMDAKRSNVVLSRRAVLEEIHKETREERFNQMALGDIVEGSVKAITDYGAFIDLGGYDSLLHSSDITFKRISHPSEVLKQGDQLKLKIIKVDNEKNRVSVSLKALQEDPWSTVSNNFKVGDRVSGTCTNITEYGVFVEISPGLEGLVHKDELSYSQKKNTKPHQLWARSQSCECVILEISEEKRRLSLSFKQLMDNPWIKYNKENPVGTILENTEITAIKDGVLFCELAEEIDGALFASELDWNLSGNDAKEMIKKYNVGDKIPRLKIISNENDKVALSIRELDGNPFDQIKDAKKGDTVTCIVTEVSDEKGLKVTVGENGPLAFIKKSDLAIEKSDARPGRWHPKDRVDCQITSIDANANKISLSIKALEETQQKEAMERYGSTSSGSSLGDILSKAINNKKSDE
tara:strand:+ start:595 stop:2310 length:1716 start_codon:yes stop_codon:yes gene_type:complete